MTKQDTKSHMRVTKRASLNTSADTPVCGERASTETADHTAEAEWERQIRDRKAETNEWQEMMGHLRQVQLENNELLVQLKDKEDEIEELRVRLSSLENERFVKPQAAAKKNRAIFQPLADATKYSMDNLSGDDIRNSTSYRLGKILVYSVAKPGRNTLLMPYRLIRLGWMAWRARKEK